MKLFIDVETHRFYDAYSPSPIAYLAARLITRKGTGIKLRDATADRQPKENKPR